MIARETRVEKCRRARNQDDAQRSRRTLPALLAFLLSVAPTLLAGGFTLAEEASDEPRASSALPLPVGSAGEPRASSDPPLLAGSTGTPSSGRGSLRGTVVVGSEIEHRRVHFPIYPDLSRQAPARTAPSLKDEIRNVVVYVEGVSWKQPRSGPPPRALVMRQANEAFEPHILPILAGSSVEFPNSDPFFHNVFSLSTASAFDLGHYPAGATRTVTFDRPGLVKVFCHLHADMSGVILVLDNPFFTIPDESGSYRIDGIPPGQYHVVAWHERARRVSRSVKVDAATETTLDFQIPIHDESDSE